MWANLEIKYPCPEEFQFMKHLMYKPVTVSSWQKVFLVNGGLSETGFFCKKLSDVACHWIIYPLDKEHVCFKSAKDMLNLSIHIA